MNNVKALSFLSQVHYFVFRQLKRSNRPGLIGFDFKDILKVVGKILDKQNVDTLDSLLLSSLDITDQFGQESMSDKLRDVIFPSN